MKIGKSDLQIETIVSRIAAGELDLQPDFQRGEIWDKKRRQRLIDTVLRGWYVPAVHLVVGAEDEAEVVLDGQQRLAAIRDFLGDGLKVDGTIEPFDPAIADLNGKTFSQLPGEWQRAVRRFVIQVITLTEFRPEEPNELFFRLNQSYNLTPPEKRNALHGEARNQVKELVYELTNLGLLQRETIGFSNGRLAYDDIVARVCVAVEAGTLRLHINNNVVEDHYRAQAFSSDTVLSVRGAAEVLLDQIEASGSRVKFNKGTLQTWLVYCYWATALTGPIPRSLLGEFEAARMGVRRDELVRDSLASPALFDVLRVYDDRASYRVTDVSSVRSRDLAVHLFSVAQFGTPEFRKSSSLLDLLRSSGSDGAQNLMFEFLDDASWGDPMIPDGSL